MKRQKYKDSNSGFYREFLLLLLLLPENQTKVFITIKLKASFLIIEETLKHNENNYMFVHCSVITHLDKQKY